MACLTQLLLLSQSGPSPCWHTVQLFTLSWTPWGFLWPPYKVFLDWSSVRNLINPIYLASSWNLLGSHSVSVLMPSSEIPKLPAQRDVCSSDLFANWLTCLHFPFLKFTREFCLAIPQGIVICSPNFSLFCLPSQLSTTSSQSSHAHSGDHTYHQFFSVSVQQLNNHYPWLDPLAFVLINSDQHHLENPLTVLTMPHCLSIRWLDGWKDPHWRQGAACQFSETRVFQVRQLPVYP